MDKSLRQICTFGTFVHTPDRELIQLHLPNVASHPTDNVENKNVKFHLIFNMYWVGGQHIFNTWIREA